ncbi:hypothetical protein CL689_06900 [Candidatus Saccharibacteria bacterium]|nr:hypothetical protein [Candidatus Saccharibacteria bacterium]|tara:strand:+ start:1622 stop:1993 length:372 start_codon:yes stop_codon:yes gene_type:complete
MKSLIELVKKLYTYDPWVPSNTEQTQFSKQVSETEFHFATWEEDFSPSKEELDNVAVAVNLEKIPRDQLESAFEMYYSGSDLSDLNHEEIAFLKAEAFFQTFIQAPVLLNESGGRSRPRSISF